MKKEYLGDGVYVELEPGLGLVLTTENGIETTNKIVLEDEVIANLLTYLQKLKQKSDEERGRH